MLDKIKDKIRNARLGTAHTDETKKKISEKMKGRVQSVETKRKISQSKKKQVIQLSITGKFIQEFSSLSEAQHHTDINRIQISSACKLLGEMKSVGGYLWRFKSFYTEEQLVNLKREAY